MSTDPEQSTGAPRGVADLRPLERRREQRAWSWYDWANSAFYTSVLTVLFAPYMITVAGGPPAAPTPTRPAAAPSRCWGSTWPPARCRPT